MSKIKSFVVGIMPIITLLYRAKKSYNHTIPILLHGITEQHGSKIHPIGRRGKPCAGVGLREPVEKCRYPNQEPPIL